MLVFGKLRMMPPSNGHILASATISAGGAHNLMKSIRTLLIHILVGW